VSEDKSALILIVDDDYDFLELNRMVLQRAGYRVATAAEPKQALLLMEEEKPGLVITDLMMTTLDSGFLFARAIKEDARYADIPVIIATSVSSALGLDFRPRTAEDHANMFVDAYFDKPLDRARLLDTITELLARGTTAAEPPAASGGGSAPTGAPPASGTEPSAAPPAPGTEA
jgi:CheY-like chemotaxis protein